MRELTVADTAFLLLCTSRHGSFQLSLSTDIGLYLDITSDGTITASLEKPKPPPGRRQSARPPTPISPIRNSIDAMMLTPAPAVPPDFPSFLPPSSSCFVRSNTPPPEPMADRSHSPNLRARKALQIKTILPPTIPTPEPTPPASPTRIKSSPGYRYIIAPSCPSTTSFYISYCPSWPYNPRSGTPSSLSKSHDSETPHSSQPVIETPGEISISEEDLEARYSLPSLISSNGAPSSSGSKWLDSYLDWVSRSQRAFARQRRRETRRASRTPSPHFDNHKHAPVADKANLKSKGPFKDEGKSTLWMVEGLLLSAWLCLQGDCAGVEYAPWGVASDHRRGESGRSADVDAGEKMAMYILDKATLGTEIREVLNGLSWC